MIKILFGLLILLIPFLLVSKFKYKKLGFFYILSFVIGFQLLVGVITQFFGIFNYFVVLVINLLVCFVVLLKTDFKKLKDQISNPKVSWILIFILTVLIIQLFSVHYNYTGTITKFSESNGTVVRGYKDVRNFEYIYPYFSDEWSAVSFIKYSIASGKLPLVNPLWHSSSFSNFGLPFHVFASEIVLLLGLNPLTQYNFLSIFSGLLICMLVYFILRFNKVGKFPAAIACLFVPYIVNGANLPVLWVFIPLIMGIISMLLGFLFISINDLKMALFLCFLILIFYPPLFVIYSAGCLLYILFSEYSRKIKTKFILFYLAVCTIVAISIALFVFLSKDPARNNLLSHLFSRIYYPTLTKNAIPDFSIWKVIPIPVLFFSVFGLFGTIKKKKWLVGPIVVGLIYWFLYSKVLWRFIIEYERIIVPTSILIVILSGFGIDYLFKKLKKISVLKKYYILQILMIFSLGLFLILSFSYTQRDNWSNLKLHFIDGRIFNPASPANQYLYEDDLRLFEGIKGKRFLSIPWKGTVIGVATDNYPLETKPATITNSRFRYSEFMNLDCNGKTEIAEKKKIDYIYSSKFDCEGFEEKGFSSEGFYLYEVKI